MKLETKKVLVNQKKNDIPPHVLEMGLNMLFIEPNDFLEYILNNSMIEAENIDKILETDKKAVFINIKEEPYSEKLDTIGFKKQQDNSLVVVAEDLIVDEYQIYLHRIYQVDAIAFPLKPITSKLSERIIFICDSIGITPIPIISSKEDLSKIQKVLEFVKVALIEGDIKLPNNIIALKKRGGNLYLCSKS